MKRRDLINHLRSCFKIPSGLRAAAKAPVGVGQIHPYNQIWADFSALTATLSLALGNSPVILKQLLREIGCVFIRHGSRHDWYQNPNTRVSQPVPRHREIKESLAKHIMKMLSG